MKSPPTPIESEAVDYQGLTLQAITLWLILCIVLLPIYLLMRTCWQLNIEGRWHLIIPIFLLYICGVIAFTLLPLPADGEFICGNSRYYPRFFPGWSFFFALEKNNGSFMDAITSKYALQVILNVVLFMPLGFFLNHFVRLKFRASLLIGFTTTLLIELTQATGLWGYFTCPYRTFDAEDLMSNTLGAVIGWALVEAWRLRKSRGLPNL